MDVDGGNYYYSYVVPPSRMSIPEATAFSQALANIWIAVLLFLVHSSNIQ
jgi:hypothetical protein